MSDATTARPDTTTARPDEATGSVMEVAAFFLRLGFTAFGGPAAHIAMMREELVRRRQWVTEQHFLDLLGATNLIPGPNSTEMALHLGRVRAGWRGLIAAGVCFIAPAMLIVLALAWAYTRFNTLPQLHWLLYGIKPVVIAVVVQAVWGLLRTAVKGPLLAAVGLITLALYLLGGNEVAILLGGGAAVMALGWIYRLIRASRTSTGAASGSTASGSTASGGAGTIPMLFSLPQLPTSGSSASGLPVSSPAAEPVLPGSVTGWPGLGATTAAGSAVTAVAGAISAVPYSAATLFLTFLKVGAVLYGSGYVLLAFLRNDFVHRLGWLTDQQLLDAISIGQFTPGPVFTTATFVGYLVGGWLGAVLATVGIFLPSFVFVAAINPLVPRLRQSKAMGGFLDGVNVAALGLMAAVTWELGRSAVVDVPTILLAVAAAALLIRVKVNSVWLILAGAMVGVGIQMAGLGVSAGAGV